MAATQTIELIERYYRAFNAEDWDGMLACLADDVVHDVNQGSRREGKAAFRDFLGRMQHCYKERLDGIVVMADATGARAAAEFNVIGTYLEAEEGLPPANGQSYRLPGGTFFAVRDGLIARVTTYYNLTDWLTQVVSDA
ncbi:MAG: ketosteroid isomerase-related protein [Hyphomicrobiaceae bacterium]|nr:ketosteroid isomerase-related protein [Hyphomicrobiaceae bacterium]